MSLYYIWESENAQGLYELLTFVHHSATFSLELELHFCSPLTKVISCRNSHRERKLRGMKKRGAAAVWHFFSSHNLRKPSDLDWAVWSSVWKTFSKWCSCSAHQFCNFCKLYTPRLGQTKSWPTVNNVIYSMCCLTEQKLRNTYFYILGNMLTSLLSKRWMKRLILHS